MNKEFVIELLSIFLYWPKDQINLISWSFCAGTLIAKVKEDNGEFVDYLVEVNEVKSNEN